MPTGDGFYHVSEVLKRSPTFCNASKGSCGKDMAIVTDCAILSLQQIAAPFSFYSSHFEPCAHQFVFILIPICDYGRPSPIDIQVPSFIRRNLTSAGD